MTGLPLPPAVRRVFLRGDVVRALRAAVEGGTAAVLVAPSATLPQCVVSWSTLDDGHRVGTLTLDDVAAVAGRNTGALAMASSPPPEGCAWALYLAPDVALGVVPFALRARASKRRPPFGLPS